MKAVILAAGRGTRLKSVTKGNPKCLLRFGSQTMLDFQILGLLRAGVEQVGIVVGHGADQVLGHVLARHPHRLERLHFIASPEYATTNNMFSLHQARRWLGGAPFVCVNADVLCHPDIFLRAMALRGDYLVVVDPNYRDETTKVRIVGNRVVGLSKSIGREEASGTFVGIATISARGGRHLFRKADSQFAAGERQQFFNDVLDQLASEGESVAFVRTGGLPWSEIDDAADLDFARLNVYPRAIERLRPPWARTA